jgi:hypothetical protein
MAPEQALGEKMDVRCDLFSLGCVFYQMTTGRLPFPGADQMAVLMAIAMDHPPPPHEVNPEVPPALSDLVVRLLAKQPDDRPASAAAVADALAAIAAERTPSLPQPPAPVGKASGGTEVLASPRTPRRRRRWPVFAALAVLLAGGGLAAFLLWRPPGQEEDKESKKVTSGTDAAPPRPTADTARDKAGSPPPRGQGKPALLPVDTLRQKDIPPGKLAVATFRHSENLPELVAVVGFLRTQTPALSLAVSPSGKFFARGDVGGMVSLWDLATQKQRRFWQGDAASDMGSVAFSPNGRLLAGACRSGEGTVKVWQVATGNQVRTFAGQPGDSRCLAFSPDGKLLATASLGTHGGQVQLWELKTLRTGKEKQPPLPGRAGRVSCLAFSRDGKTLAAGMDKAIRVWDLEAGKQLPALVGVPRPATSLVFGPLGKRLYSTHEDDVMVRAWSLGKRQPRQPVPHTSEVRSAVLSRDGKTLAAAGKDGTVVLWNIPSGTIKKVFRLGPGNHPVRQVVYTPEGRHLAAVNGTGAVYVLRLSPPPAQDEK